MNASPVMVVTGARKGIGRHLVTQALERGYHVVGCSRSESDLKHERYTHHCLDVTDEGAVTAMFRQVQAEHGRLDVLVNNAGIAAMNSFLLTPLKQAQAIFDTNLKGSFLCAREAAKLMSARRFGRIVNFSTVAVPFHLAGEAAYVASKAGVVALTQTLAHELGGLGITVNCVGPTPVETDLIGAVPKEKIDALIKRQAVRRMGKVEDVANAVFFFLRPESDFISGQILYLGGVS
jgi:3-oxoacyl-[acyl-carrier protein] reductase